MIVIRFVENKDYKDVLRMSESFLSASNLPFDINTGSIKMLFDIFINDPQKAIGIVAEKDNIVIGMLAFIVAPHIFNRNVVCAEEIVWWVDPEYRLKTGMKMLEEAEILLKNRGINYSAMKHLHKKELSPDIMDKFFMRKGYEKIETSFIKRL